MKRYFRNYVISCGLLLNRLTIEYIDLGNDFTRPSIYYTKCS